MVSISTKEKSFLVFICDFTMLYIWRAKNPTIRNMNSCFANIEKDIPSIWYVLNINSTLLTSSLASSLVLATFQKYLDCNFEWHPPLQKHSHYLPMDVSDDNISQV